MFITFEGGEGSGKTTLIEKLRKTLLNQKYDVLVTREPGGSKIAEKIRSVLLDNKNEAITAHTEALLFAASRAQHLDEVVIPNLNKIILCDRYIDSSFAYQAYGRDLGMDYVKHINIYALSYMPDLTFYIDIDPKTGIDRVKSRRKHKNDRLDLEQQTFHEKVRQGYLEVAKLYSNRIITINGNQTIDAIYEEILNEILKRL